MLPNERNMLLKFKLGARIESDMEFHLLEKAGVTGLVGFGMGVEYDSPSSLSYRILEKICGQSLATRVTGYEPIVKRFVSEAHLTSRGKWFLRA